MDTKFAHLDKEGLKDLVSTYHIPKDSLPKGIQTLMSIRQLAIGRSILNHSELTAKNIGLSGVNVEFTSDWYGAASVGFIDQQFRDQQLLQNKLPKQWLSLVSVGRGDKEKAAIIFTYFTGKRNLFAQYVTGNTGMQPNNVSGTSIQGIYRLGTQHQFIGEIAKSNYSSLAGIDQSVSKISMSNWLSMKDHQNEAYSIAYNGTYKSTGTGLELSYRKTGRYFQSYSFYNTPSIQESWKFQLDQHIRQWMKLRIGLQKNQFDFPMLTSGFKGDNIFKTAQILIQVKKWPLVMLGYYPSSQITFTDGQVPVESRFNTLNVSLTHSYKAARTYMNSSIVYTRFYNQSTDSSFIYYNTKNLALTQVLYLGNWSLQGSYTKIWQDDRTRLNVCDVQTSCSASEMFSFNAGAKLNNLSGGANNVLGYSAGCTISIKRFAMLQVQYDKSHWPGPSRNLVPVTNGRLTFVKTF